MSNPEQDYALEERARGAALEMYDLLLEIADEQPDAVAMTRLKSRVVALLVAMEGKQ